jgi:hypothetical protein
MATIGQTAIAALKIANTADAVEDSQTQDAGLQQRVDQQCRPGPASSCSANNRRSQSRGHSLPASGSTRPDSITSTPGEPRKDRLRRASQRGEGTHVGP